MGEQFERVEQQEALPVVDVAGLAERLDRMDILLLKQFYHTGQPHPNDTICHVLRLLVDSLQRSRGPLAKLSYGAIRYRLENLVALGLLGKVHGSNPAAYVPLDLLAGSVRRIIVLYAADLVGLWRGQEAGTP